jgi:hypothetical protein
VGIAGNGIRLRSDEEPVVREVHRDAPAQNEANGNLGKGSPRLGELRPTNEATVGAGCKSSQGIEFVGISAELLSVGDPLPPPCKTKPMGIWVKRQRSSTSARPTNEPTEASEEGESRRAKRSQWGFG